MAILTTFAVHGDPAEILAPRYEVLRHRTPGD